MAATGTKANIQKLGLQNIGLHLSKSSHVLVNKKAETNLSNTIHFRYTELWQSIELRLGCRRNTTGITTHCCKRRSGYERIKLYL